MRVRWLSIDLRGVTLQSVADQMLRDVYDGSRNWGFRIDSFLDGVLVGRFVEQLTIKEEFTDPLGKTVANDRVEYLITRFRMQQGGRVLELRDPPRSVRSLSGQISTYSGYEAVIEPARTSLANILVAARAAGTVTVLRMKVSGITLKTSVAAKLDVAGSDDVLVPTAEFIGKRNHRVDAVRLRLQRPGQTMEDVTVSAVGSLASPGDLSDSSLAWWREAVVSALETATSS